MRRVAMLAVVVVFVASLGGLPTGPADAAVMCQGKAATIVGVGQADVTGTEGDDVIVAAGVVRALGGNDTVCTTGLFVDAGAGDDSVTTDDTAMVRKVDLGDGDDTYVGGSGPDVVDGIDPYYDGYQLGDDTISTGGGDDLAYVGVPRGESQADVVDLGDGDDRVYVFSGGFAPGGSVVGGPGHDRVDTEVNRSTAQRVLLDLPHGSLTVDGAPFASWSELETFQVRLRGPDSVRLIGTPRADDVRLKGVGTIDARLGAGDDLFSIFDNATGRIDGGAGRDRLVPRIASVTRVDLEAGFLGTTGQPRRRSRLVGFEDVAVPGSGVVVGDRRANDLAVGCGRVHAGAGADHVTQSETFYFYDEGASAPRRCRGTFVAFGGPGNDLIRGTTGRDDLVGGPGVDRANGLAGRDRCVAERRLHCERP